MSENAELWSWPDEKSQLRTLQCWFREHNIDIGDETNIEVLRQLYIDIECGNIQNKKGNKICGKENQN